ncbi:MAG: hypothetical protein ACRCR2_08295 [Fusobacteriaceae bacterium]
MTTNSFYQQEAKIAYTKLTKGLFNFFSVSKTSLKDFLQVQNEKNATTKISLGIQEVPLEKIVGSVHKTADFNSEFIPINPVTEVRWCNIYAKFLEDGNLPPVSLYKIKDEYFVYDGNHRVSVAKYLNFNKIEAEVTEFMANTQLIEDIIYNERFFFQRQTELEGIDFLYSGGYEKIIKEIEKFKTVMKLESESMKSLSLMWKKNLFNPITKIFHLTDLFHDIPNGHLYIKVLDYMDSHENFGYLKSTLDLIDYYDLYLSDNIRRQLNKIDSFDTYLGKNLNIVEKAQTLENFVGIELKKSLKIIREIDSLPLPDGASFSKKLETWYNERFIFRYALIEQRIEVLPEKYRTSWIYVDNAEKLTLEFIKYEILFQQKYPFKLSQMEIVLNYILEVYIPIVDLLYKKGDIRKLYYPMSRRYRKLHGYKKKASMKDALNLIYSNKNYSRHLYSSDPIHTF